MTDSNLFITVIIFVCSIQIKYSLQLVYMFFKYLLTEILPDLMEQDKIQQLQREKGICCSLLFMYCQMFCLGAERLLDLLSNAKKKTDDMSKEFSYLRGKYVM